MIYNKEKKGIKGVLLTLTKKKREKKYKENFYKKFKTITFNNGLKFLVWEGIEKSYIRKKRE